MLFGRFRILGKLGLLVLVPLIGVVALSVPIVLNRVDAARDAQRTADAVDLAGRVGSTLQELQQERLLSVGYLFGLVPQSELALQSATVDAKVAELYDLELSAPLRQSLDWVANLGRTRADVLARRARPDFVVADFTNVVTPIINALGLSREADLTTAAGRQVFALDLVLRTDDLISQAAGALTSAVFTGEPGFVGLFSQKLVELQVVVLQFNTLATPQQAELYLQAQESFVTRVGRNFFLIAATDPAAAVRTLTIGTLFPSLRSIVVLGRFLENQIETDVKAAVAINRSNATRTAYLVSGGTIALLGLVFLLSLLMARAVARPLRRLTASADRIARAGAAELERVADDDVDSPRPIHLDAVDVQARDEIGDLARAFERVQSTAARLVERQVAGRRNVAQMFGHVGRRTQNLVGRQLSLIDQLERQETDPDRLRELYRLDHMSSRLRRNAGSLVVLSGDAGADDLVEPLPLADVVRLALGEIEDYTRVDVEVPEDLIVAPALVNDLTLVLAEIMENATSFSPPHTRVTVAAAARPNGGARMAVVDHGLGLPEDRIAEENARLARRERLDLAPTEVLGLFVVGRLARRHGLDVRLAETPDGGLTVWLDLRPHHLLAQTEALTARTGATPLTPLIAGAATRTVGGSAQPFDPVQLDRATRTLEAGTSWNAFQPLNPLPAAPPGSPVVIEPTMDGPPWPAAEVEVSFDVPVETESPPVANGYVVPRQRRADEVGASTLRRRVPGHQLPETPPVPVATATPTAQDAQAARELVEAVESGVSRAQLATAGPPPLMRRTPGASLPAATAPAPPAAAYRPAHDPDEARNLIEQFEYGVALALRDTSPQHEGQPR